MTPNYNFIRKPPADFGWDWGPNFTPAGIYGKLALVAHSHAYLAGETCESNSNGGSTGHSSPRCYTPAALYGCTYTPFTILRSIDGLCACHHCAYRFSVSFVVLSVEAGCLLKYTKHNVLVWSWLAGLGLLWA